MNSYRRANAMGFSSAATYSNRPSRHSPRSRVMYRMSCSEASRPPCERTASGCAISAVWAMITVPPRSGSALPPAPVLPASPPHAAISPTPPTITSARATRRSIVLPLIRSVPPAGARQDPPVSHSDPVATRVRLNIAKTLVNSLETLLEIQEGVRLRLSDAALIGLPHGPGFIAINDCRQCLQHPICFGITVPDPLERLVALVAVEQVAVIDAELGDPPDDHRVEIALIRPVDLVQQGPPLEDPRLCGYSDASQVGLHLGGDVGADLIPLVRLHHEVQRVTGLVLHDPVPVPVLPSGLRQQRARRLGVVCQILPRLRIILPEEG